MREVGSILVSVGRTLSFCFSTSNLDFKKFNGSYERLLAQFISHYSGRGTALQLVRLITNEFPAFRDEASFKGKRSELTFLRNSAYNNVT